MAPRVRRDIPQPKTTTFTHKKLTMKMCLFPIILLTLTASAYPARADLIFSDNFDSGASPLWGHEVGTWVASGGVYQETALAFTAPPTNYSGLPFQLKDFVVDVDINNVDDGGIWLRSSDNNNGILLVTGGDGGTHSGHGGDALYWHIFVNGVALPGPGGGNGTLNIVRNVFTPGVSDPHIRVEVIGDTYSAFVNGTLITSLTTNAYANGRVALYDNSGQTFDNVEVRAVPEPTTFALLVTGLMPLVGVRVLQKSGLRSASRWPF